MDSLEVPRRKKRSRSIGAHGDVPSTASEPSLCSSAKQEREGQMKKIGVDEPAVLSAACSAKLEDMNQAAASVDQLKMEDKQEDEGEKEEQEDELPAYEGKSGHIFTRKTFHQPTYCTACHGFLWGIRKQGSACRICSAPVHDKCRDLIEEPCYTPKSVEVGDTYAFEHHWLPGNLHGASSWRCVVCNKSCKGGRSSFKNSHCSVCRRCVHRDCISSALVCTPVLRPLIFCKELMEREVPYPDYTPLLVFVNSKSGGQQGAQLIRRLRRLLTQEQVVDMFSETPVGPDNALKKYAHVANLRILVCGGDGTGGWVMSAMDKLEEFNERKPPIAMLPLGTGNDLARVLGWGGGYEGENLAPILEAIVKAEVTKLDRWSLHILEHETAKEHDHVFNNYFSIGVDAKIAMKFHQLRESNPDLFVNRVVNKGVYGTFGIQNVVTKSETMKDMNVKVVVDRETLEMDRAMNALEGLVFLNIQSYAGGTDLWGRVRPEADDTKTAWMPGAMDDGKLEVVGMRGVAHMVAMQAGISGGDRISQGGEIVITGSSMDVQVDGEPFHIGEATLTISFFNSVRMLKASK